MLIKFDSNGVFRFIDMVEKYLFLRGLRQHILVLLFCIVQNTTADFTSESTNASVVIFPDTQTTSSEDIVTSKLMI